MQWIYYSIATFFCQVFSCDPNTTIEIRERPVVGSNHNVNYLNFPLRNPNVRYYEYEIFTRRTPIAQDNMITNQPKDVVFLKDGSGLKGFEMKSLNGKAINAFQSIPYAEPPVGDLRFKPPVKKGGWKGIRDAIADAPTCIQTDFLQLYKLTGQEDCLYLNIYTTKLPERNGKSPKLPVLVNLHLGGFYFGSSNLYGPSYLASGGDVVIVTLNYRLGVFGFLSTGDMAQPGNNGFKDQAMALKFIKENIERFGGDSSNILLFGESAGSSSVQFHLLSPLSRGYFHKAISQSGSSFCSWSIAEKAPEIATTFANALKCTGNSFEIIECMKKIDANTLAMAQLSFLKWQIYPVVTFGPVVEPKHKGAFLDEQPHKLYEKGQVAQVPWISGYNSDEGALNIASILIDPKAQGELNKEWSRVGPILLDLIGDFADPSAAADKIRKFYLGEEEITFENRKKAVDMFGERYLIYCGLNAIEYHAKYASKPVYSYYLNYKGSKSIVQAIGQNPKDWGVSHIDDMIYLMNSTTYAKLTLEDEDYKMSQIMQDLWINFARTGKPMLTKSDGSLSEIWTPAGNRTSTSLNFLELNLNPRMVNNPFEKTLSFWNELDKSNINGIKRPYKYKK